MNGELRYVPNPKHKEPWQRGRRGSLYPREISGDLAQQLLDQSVLDGKHRYAVHEGRAYCAQADGVGGRHGYPVGWKEVPARLKNQWVRQKLVKKSDLERYR